MTSRPFGCTTGITPVTSTGEVTRRRPGQPAVVRALEREDLAARLEVGVGQVAAAAERARRAVVAGEPLLVVGELGRLRDRRLDRGAPREPVARPVHREPGRDAVLDREPGDQPDAVLDAVGDDGIAGAIGRPGRHRGRRQARQQAPRATFGRRPSRSRSRGSSRRPSSDAPTWKVRRRWWRRR